MTTLAVVGEVGEPSQSTERLWRNWAVIEISLRGRHRRGKLKAGIVKRRADKSLDRWTESDCCGASGWSPNPVVERRQIYSGCKSGLIRPDSWIE